MKKTINIDITEKDFNLITGLLGNEIDSCNNLYMQNLQNKRIRKIYADLGDNAKRLFNLMKEKWDAKYNNDKMTN